MTEYKSEPFIDVRRGGFWCRCSIGFTLESDLIAHLTAHGENPKDNQRALLESTLATTFIAQQREQVPAERTRLWGECLRLVDEIERLNGSDNNSSSD